MAYSCWPCREVGFLCLFGHLISSLVTQEESWRWAVKWYCLQMNFQFHTVHKPLTHKLEIVCGRTHTVAVLYWPTNRYSSARQAMRDPVWQPQSTIAKFLGHHLAIAKAKASPLALRSRGNDHLQEGCWGVSVCGHWDRDRQTGKELLRKPSSTISSGGAGLLQATCCYKPAGEAVPTSLTVSALFPQTGRAAHMKTAAFTEKHQPNQYRSTKDISVWHLAPFWQGSDVFPVPAPLWRPAEPSLPYQAARWFWRRRTTNTLLPSAGQHRETLLDLKTKSPFSLTARGFPLRSIWTLHIWDRQQRGKTRGHFYGCSFSFPPCCWFEKRKGIQGCIGWLDDYVSCSLMKEGWAAEKLSLAWWQA